MPQIVLLHMECKKLRKLIIAKLDKRGTLLINVVFSSRNRVLLDILTLETIGLQPKTQRYLNSMISECISLVIFIFRCPLFAPVIGVNAGHYPIKYWTVFLFTPSLIVIHGVKADHTKLSIISFKK